MNHSAAVVLLCAIVLVSNVEAWDNSSACDCPAYLFSCGNCICIPQRWACDGDNDCGNHKDEQSCGTPPPCPPGFFTCKNQRCIKEEWLCDRDNDCADNSDELNCVARNCSEKEYRCDNKKCISREWLCDHDDDCGDGSDENCDSKLSCNNKQFRCRDDMCIPLAWKCDKDLDCSQGEDELNCEEDEIFCSKHEFQCRQERRCIPLTMKCDQVNDCGDWEDEKDCEMLTSCEKDEFQCGDGTCIRSAWRCDEDVDCDDQSDEKNCTTPVCTDKEFTCTSGMCIDKYKHCDGMDNCPDNSDEEGCSPLKDICGPSMFECDNQTCIHTRSVCDGKPDCQDGSDEAACVMQEMLLFARRMYLQRMVLDETRSYQIIPLINISHAIAIDFDPVEKRVYWTDDERRIIGRANLDGSDQEAILKVDIDHPDGIAVDSVHRTIYWTDTGTNKISRANLDGTNRTIILSKGLDEPRDIAVDPINGYIYWSDWGSEAKIERAALNGSDRMVIRNIKIKWPNGIGLDVPDGKIYWGDARLNTIERANMDGSNPEIVLNGVPHVFGITVYGNNIYWTDWQTRTIERVNKNNKIDREIILKDVVDVMDIKAVSIKHKINMCKPTEYGCLSGQCISRSEHCDGVIQCLDASDEIGCTNIALTCAPEEFHCTNNHCISNAKKCNGINDCGDDSDENNCSFPPADCNVNKGGCEQVCKQLTMGVHCSCYSGYKLQSDWKSCRDVNECNWMGTCSQQCINVPGSFNCSCVAGYELKPDKRGCKAIGGKAYLIFANRVDIRKVLPDLTEYDSILKGLENAIALDFHIKQGYVYWSDVALDKIMRAFLNGTGVEEVVQYGLESPGGLAVDWIHNNLYWTDSGTSVIEVMDLDLKYRKVLVWENLEKPRAIVTHPGHGLLFWTDWGTVAKIERCGMDSSERMIIANTSLFWPNGLTLDYATDKLFWADAKHHVIECSNLDGSQRRTILSQGLPHPFALTVFEDDLYWTDWHTKSINKANKFTGNDVEIVHSRLHFPMDIHSLHPQRQPDMLDRCMKNNGGCSHFCLPSPKLHPYTCDCPSGQHLLPDLKTCTSDMEQFLLLSTSTDIRRVNMVTAPGRNVVIPVSNMISPLGLDFDGVENMIYWTDTELDTISRAKIDGSHEQVLIRTRLDSPAGIAVDWVCRKLYWTDAMLDVVEVSNLDGTQRNILVWDKLDKPRDIIVDPVSGYMFWTDWGETPKIEKAGMDGKGRVIIIKDGVKWPNGLALDPDDDRLFWTDAGFDHIESSSMNGQKRKVIISVDMPQPFGLALHQDKIYWSDWVNNGIHAASKVDGSGREVIQAGIGKVNDIRIFHKNQTRAHSECLVDNGGCSHLCLMAPLPRGHSCACPTGVLLQSDQKTCHDDMNNFLIYARRTDIRKVSLDVWYFADVVMPLKGLRNVIAVDVDYINGKVYWTDTVLDKIMRANLDSSQAEEVISNGLDTPDGLAVDTVGQKIYWTDTDLKRIEVADMNGKMRRVLIWEDLDKPRAIALHYEYGFMYFSDWGKVPRIERAWMDGNNRQTIISKNLGWPNGLVIDRETSKLIWADAKMEVIECADLDGSGRKILVDNVKHPYGLTVFGDHIYWTDWQKLAILQADKQTGQNQTMKRRNLSGLMDIHAVQRGIKSPVNHCEKKNGGCSHLCLPNPKGISCACPTGLKMKKNGKTCQKIPDKFLLFASRGSIRRISMDTDDYSDVVLPFRGLHNVIAVDFDLQEQKIYYTDVLLDVIKKANFDGSDPEVVVKKDLETTDGLAVDWIGRNLYWTDAGKNRIEVSWLRGQYRKSLIKEGLDEPRAIALHPEGGLMFWTDWGDTPKIECSNMDGTHRSAIINANLGFPNGLSVDYSSERLYWVDAKLDKIETSDFYGNNRVHILENVPHPFGLTVYGKHIYWTDWQTEQIERADKTTGKGRQLIQGHLEGLMDLEMVAKDRQTGHKSCSVKNGGCTYLCLATHTGRSRECPDRHNACSVKNGGCTHLCLATPTGRSYECPDSTSAKDFVLCCRGHNACSVKNGGCTHLCLATPTGRSCECPDSTSAKDFVLCHREPMFNPMDSNHFPVYNAGMDDTKGCTETKARLGLCEMPKKEQQSGQSSTRWAMVGLGLGIVVLAILIAFIVWKVKTRRNQSAYRVESEEFVSLNFANPTYQRTSTETINLDRASSNGSQEWKIFKFKQKDQQPSSGSREPERVNSERAMLIQQVDSSCVAHTTHVPDKMSATLFKSKYTSGETTNFKPKVPYKPVDT